MDVSKPPRTSLPRALGGDRVRCETVMPLLVSLLLRRAKQTGASSMIARAPSSPTRSSGRSVPLAARSSAGKRPLPVSARSSTTTVVSPPSGSDAVAMTRSEPPSAIARRAQRLARGEGRKAVERVDQQRDMAAAGSLAPGRVHGALDRLRAGVGRRREGQRRGRLEAVRRPAAQLPGRAPARTRLTSTPSTGVQHRQHAQRLRLAGERGAGDRHASRG